MAGASGACTDFVTDDVFADDIVRARGQSTGRRLGVDEIRGLTTIAAIFRCMEQPKLYVFSLSG